MHCWNKAVTCKLPVILLLIVELIHPGVQFIPIITTYDTSWVCCVSSTSFSYCSSPNCINKCTISRSTYDSSFILIIIELLVYCSPQVILCMYANAENSDFYKIYIVSQLTNILTPDLQATSVAAIFSFSSKLVE